MNDPFQPGWLRAGLVLAIATASFFIPQEVPLEYYPLNNPSSGLQYLEVTCAANTNGETRFYLDFGHGYNELDKIQLPIGPSEMAFTYTFPLLDGPLMGLRVDPFMAGAGELTITNFRIINRREEQICRFDKDSFYSPHEIAGIVPVENGWKIISRADSKDPYVFVRLPHPLIPEGMNERNLKRCLLSTGYLAFMLWLILMAVYFALRLFPSWKAAARACLFLLFMASAFSFVGNRGLIKNSCFYAKKAHRIEQKALQTQLPQKP